MICSKLLKLPPTSSHLSPLVVSRPKSSDASNFSRCSAPSKMCVRAQGGDDPTPNGIFGSQYYPRKATAGLSHTMTARALADNLKLQQQSSNGIGIVEFLEGKNYFVTGATGLLAKAFVEKILRMSLNVGKIYLLMRADDEQAAHSRLIGEIIKCEAFQHQLQKYGEGYEKFMLSKLIPVAGDIAEPNLGIRSKEMMNRIIEEVEVIVHSAANVTFDGRYDALLNTNVLGTSRTLELAKNCKKLRVFLHVSTAFVNGMREGFFLEELSESWPAPFLKLDMDEERKLVIDMAETVPKRELSLKMREVGMARAKSYGFKNTYELSKAMAEMVIHRSRGELMVVVVRPSVVESTYQEPFPGWIQGKKVIEPVVIFYGKGQLPSIPADPEVVLDIVPLDVVVNAMVAAMAKHGKSADSGLFTYHISSSTVNPLTLFDLFKSFHSHFTFAPLTDDNGGNIIVEEVKFVELISEFRYLVEKAVLQKDLNETSFNENGARELKKNKRIFENITQLVRLYEPYLFKKARFDNSNTDKLIKEMSENERWDFPGDVRRIDWEDYFVNIHIPGVRKHVMKKPIKSPDSA